MPPVAAAPAVSPPWRYTSPSGSYRTLAGEVALRYAGGNGVRRAGLTAVQFVRLFTALIEIESGFNPRAVSPVGAQGLAQLMPGTAAGLGVSDPFDPVANLDGGARYLVAQLDRFGSVTLALAAYNAGPERVIEYGGVPPFAETQAHIAAVIARAGLDLAAPAVTVDADMPASVIWDGASVLDAAPAESAAVVAPIAHPVAVDPDSGRPVRAVVVEGPIGEQR